jgi:MSHA biogenesis protein MshN
VALEREGRANALQWLESEPPGPGTMPAYHTMMAALYQQTGNHQAAAEQWAALIETDDGNARWWAGLGIAMESRGRDEQARAAYTRALSLPELAPALRQYIEQRLAAEQG